MRLANCFLNGWVPDASVQAAIAAAAFLEAP